MKRTFVIVALYKKTSDCRITIISSQKIKRDLVWDRIEKKFANKCKKFDIRIRPKKYTKTNTFFSGIRWFVISEKKYFFKLIYAKMMSALRLWNIFL